MRSAGINWGAVLAAAIAIYAIGFIIYGVLVPPERWMAMAGISAEEMATVGTSRMMFSPLMPLATAIFLGVLFKLGKVQGASTGAQWAVVVAFASAIPALWYGWVYGVHGIDGTLLDSAHLLLGHAVAGAILGGWR